MAASGKRRVLGLIIDHLSGSDRYLRSDLSDISGIIDTYRSICGDDSRGMVEVAYRVPPMFQPYGDIDICMICGANASDDDEKEEHLLKSHRQELEKIAMFISTFNPHTPSPARRSKEL